MDNNLIAEEIEIVETNTSNFIQKENEYYQEIVDGLLDKISIIKTDLRYLSESLQKLVDTIISQILISNEISDDIYNKIENLTSKLHYFKSHLVRRGVFGLLKEETSFFALVLNDYEEVTRDIDLKFRLIPNNKELTDLMKNISDQ